MSTMAEVLNAKAAQVAPYFSNLMGVLGSDANNLQIAEALLARYERELKTDDPAAANFFTTLDQLEAHAWVHGTRTWTPNMAGADTSVFLRFMDGFNEEPEDHQPSLWTGMTLIKEWYDHDLEHNNDQIFTEMFFLIRCAQRYFDEVRLVASVEHQEQEVVEDETD